MAIRKRKHGTGAETWFFDFYDQAGKRLRQGGFRTKTEALAAYDKIKADITTTGTYIQNDKTLTFTRAASEFIELHASVYCKPSTVKGYQSNLDNHLIPFFGNIKLFDITPRSIEKFIHEMLTEEELSNKTINNCLTLMHTVIQKTVDNGLLFQNPVSKVRRLTVIQEEMRFLEFEEIYTVLDVAKAHFSDFYPLLLTAIATGMRRGELVGLTWDRINWKTSQIHINKSLYKGKLLPPKTLTSIRKVDMPDELIKVLKEWKLRCPNGKMNLIFPNSEGNPMDADNMVRRRFDPVLRKSGIDKIRFHDLRHTFASVLIAQNVPIKYIQKQLGHSSIQVTMDRYGHLMPEVNKQGIEALNNVLKKKLPEANLKHMKC